MSLRRPYVWRCHLCFPNLFEAKRLRRLQLPVIAEVRVSVCGRVFSPAALPIFRPSTHVLVACLLGLEGFAQDLARDLFVAYCGRSLGRGPALRRAR